MKPGIGCVYLGGAGCGEADLITVRGQRLLQNCDTVVYDDLIAGELLSALPERTELLYMGKRQGAHSASQAEICAVLIDKAREGRSVVRLKGGDPFVFGRGGEEAMALREAGIPWEVVPGVSSAIAIPEEAGIPVTHRGVSQSFHVITAHTAGTPDGLPPERDALARLPGTLVFLMGLSRLEVIAQRLIAAGMAPGTPAAVISGGSAPHPAAVRGTLADIAPRTRTAGVRSPAVILVGQTAAMDLSSTVSRPLAGVQVGLTGTDAVTKTLRLMLKEMGAGVFSAQRSLVEPFPLSFDLETLCGGEPRWLVFTSANGVRLFFQRLHQRSIDLRRLGSCRFAAVGPATAAALERRHIHADLQPERFTTEALGRCLLHAVPPESRVLLFRSRRGSRALYETLTTRFTVEDVPLYDLRSDPRISQAARSRLDAMDYLIFSSASGVELYFEAQGAVPPGTTCVCIGEITAAALRRQYAMPFLVAPDISVQGIIQAIMEHHGA